MRRPNARTVNPSLENDKQMDPVKLRFRPNRPGFRSPNIKYTIPRSRFVLYSSIFVALVLSCYILFFGRKNQETKRYGVVIDGGSTGTRIHVFKYEVRKGKMVLDFSEKGSVSMKVHPGLSAYVEEPEGAGTAVAELVEFAKRHVPKELWTEVDIRLMATAGMRLLKNEDQERILNVCRRVLRESGFQFKDDGATVISGSDEGLYAWVVANYALGTLGGHPTQTTGIIELGGASVQLTFATNEPIPLEFSRKVSFGNFTYNLYSHSFLQFGQNVAFELLKESLVAGGQVMATEFLQTGKPVDPCTPRGYTHDEEAWKLSPASVIQKNRYLSNLLPNGNFSGCRSASIELLQKGRGSKFIPKLQGKFLATENFFHTSKFFGLRERAFLSDLMVSGQDYCGENWSKLKRKYPSLEEEELLRYCFSSAYIIALLHDNLGISLHDTRIAYANQVENILLDWALGAFILQYSSKLDMQHSNWIASIIGGDSSALMLLFGIFLVLILMTWIISKLRKPQLKTIYDLEKGKYIITRVGRYS
ncbi:probable apyrase 6 [Henckelia pumila]|uniref:probable apyrase 6 n=1 Tax=Henckelia pumila TaxID=405737 RepID=UPI003C6E6CD9